MTFTIYENDLTAASGIAASRYSRGIYLKAGDNIGSEDYGSEESSTRGLWRNKVLVKGHYAPAYGVLAEAEDGLFLNIKTNDITIAASESTENSPLETYGILLKADDIGSVDNAVKIQDKNRISVECGGYANGILAQAEGDLFIDITNNSDINDNDIGISVIGARPRGINLESGGNMGSEEKSATISNNKITVTSIGGGSTDLAYGILMKSEDKLFTKILENKDITVGMTINTSATRDAYGIFLSSSNEMGSGINPLRIYSNNIKVTSNGTSYGNMGGIYLSSLNENIYSLGDDGKIAENEITVEVKNRWYTDGIKLNAGKDIIADISNNKIKIRSDCNNLYGINISKIVDGNYAPGARTIGLYSDPTVFPYPPAIPPVSTVFSNNTIDIENLRGTAYGFFLNARDYLFADISDNKLNLKGIATYGAYLRTFNKLIGNATTPTTFLRNVGLTEGEPGVIEGAARYLMYLQTGMRGDGNNVVWYNNYVSPYQNGVLSTWSGRYPDRSGVPFYHAIWHNFIIAPGRDTL